MDILHVLPTFRYGGMEKIICSIIQYTNHQYRHRILALDGYTSATDWIDITDAQLVPFPPDKKIGSRTLFFRSLFHELRSARPHLLMTYNWGSTDAIWLGRLAGIKNIIHSEHGLNADEGVRTIWKRDMIRFMVYRLASNLVVVSHELERMMRYRFHLSSKRVIRISNGVDGRFWSPDFDERQRVRRSLGFAETDVVIGFSGRLDPVKNLDLLLDIFGRCAPHDYSFRLLIVGDGPERRHLEGRCQAEGFHSYVRFVGEQTQVLPYLRAMDVLLLTSLREQMPLTVLEAMAAGVPVIATRVGELQYVIDDGTDGFIRDPDVPAEAFAKALGTLLCSSRRKTMGAAARQKILTKFRQQTMLKRYLDLIRQFA